MEIHLENETRHVLRYGIHPGDRTPCLTHLVLSGAYIDKHRLRLEGELSVSVQTRFHGCGNCSSWERINACYVKDKFLERLLLPTTGSERVFRLQNDRLSSCGGLFISFPIYFRSDNRTYDEFNTVVIKILTATGPHDPIYLYFIYGEFMVRGDAFEHDEARFPAMIQQLRRHLLLREPLDRKFLAMLRNIEEESKTSPSDLIPAKNYTQERTDYPVRVVKPSRSKPISATPSILGARFGPQPASGLKTKAPTNILVSSGLASAVRNTAARIKTGTAQIESILERPSFARHAGDRQFPPIRSVNDILYEEDNSVAKPQPITPRSLLLQFCLSMGHNPGPHLEWILAPISIQPRRDYHTGKEIYIIKYNASTMNRLLISHPLTSGLDELLKIGLLNNVVNPRNFTKELKEEAIERTPVMACALIAPQYSIFSTFGVNPEEDSMYALKNTLLTAFAQSIRHSLIDTHLPQTILYHLPADLDYDTLASLVPNSIDALLQTEYASEIGTFLKSSLFVATMAHRAKNNGNYESGYDDDVYLFDYYLLSTALQKDNKLPNIVKFTKTPHVNVLSPADVRVDRSGLVGTRVYSPGEFYLHVALGFDLELNAILVFPGGFTFQIDYKTEFYKLYRPELDKQLLPRFCRGRQSPLPCPSIAP
ncbi:DNA packaging tegument protein UL17 [Testudinid alphaherpesvirus 3]|uniref:DNA packaging tegument protein UL17 n=1 Tax=Testudinid alphaherpesvirus 3 TaxID=2560801 RepID=A0A0K1R1C0_9ALPH|nr:DNA packaging tegument protein UL17 [Testudinid alphaherpesvirus 3]AIU39278.1 DNA packaging tegument protein UL17 [Testudinid alphaherpesvirus 3]AIU39388.1 DNA packaging tegument protein UL17 [Testudinid alphaherpesvirus 3]AKI81664.1 DNA packaging tegument protein UL17 [Testudinid alphaherpesvirus 3]AKI81767.1 DNA packaging tegument protein UL17 [Testudinid alphaherpesvirus 3]AKV40688.1 UL17 virion packaging protein [Testudinid alphaherpesvirus 3]